MNRQPLSKPAPLYQTAASLFSRRSPGWRESRCRIAVMWRCRRVGLCEASPADLRERRTGYRWTQFARSLSDLFEGRWAATRRFPAATRRQRRVRVSPRLMRSPGCAALVPRSLQVDFEVPAHASELNSDDVWSRIYELAACGAKANLSGSPERIRAVDIRFATRAESNSFVKRVALHGERKASRILALAADAVVVVSFDAGRVSVRFIGPEI